MKKLLIIGIVFGVFFSSCRRDIYPDARFTVNYIEVQPDDDVIFTDLSRDAIEYYWDFDDGYTSTASNPIHSFAYEGDYTVSLEVTSVDGRKDITTMVIHVWYTALEITAAEWNDDEIIEYTIPGAFIALYDTDQDWYYDRNPIVWGNTDRVGMITFLGLDSRRYWVWVEAEDVYENGDYYNNDEFWDYYPDDYLATYVLTPFAINPWTAWADYFYANKSDQKRRPNYVGQKIKADRRTLIKEEDVSE